MARIHRLKQEGVAPPGALYAGTPWTDLTRTGDSDHLNEGAGSNLPTHDGMVAACARLRAAGRDLEDPLISPIHGDLSGFPPSYLVSGTGDLILGCVVRAHARLWAAGVEAEPRVFEGLSHSEHIFQHDTPESRQVHSGLSEFPRRHLR